MLTNSRVEACKFCKSFIFISIRGATRGGQFRAAMSLAKSPQEPPETQYYLQAPQTRLWLEGIILRIMRLKRSYQGAHGGSAPSPSLQWAKKLLYILDRNPVIIANKKRLFIPKNPEGGGNIKNKKW